MSLAILRAAFLLLLRDRGALLMALPGVMAVIPKRSSPAAVAAPMAYQLRPVGSCGQ